MSKERAAKVMQEIFSKGTYEGDLLGINEGGKMSDTPRTDAQFNDEYCYGGYVSTEFAQQLERELAEAKEQLRLCNVDQFTTAAELAEATVKESLIAQRPWVGLTAEDMADAHNSTSGDVMMRLAGFARAIEAKLKDKNT